MMDLSEVVAAVAKARRDPNTVIVMTNGCFDLLHAGHVQSLQEARALGTHLLVCVNNDGSVARLKGYGRPVVPLEDRITMLSALRVVDWVLPFGEECSGDTPLEVVSAVLPDLLVKGGDYGVDAIAGAAEVMKNGGKVAVLPLLAGRSTTSLIDRIVSICNSPGQ